MINIKYALINKDNYEFLDNNGETTKNIFEADLYDESEYAFLALEHDLDHDTIEEFDVVKVRFTYDLERVK